MTQPQAAGCSGIRRRRLLALTGLPALGLLPACGDSGDSEADAQAATVRELPMASVRSYRSTSLTDFSVTEVNARTAGVGAAEDRFGAVDAAYVFLHADAWASIDALPTTLPIPLSGDFALSFWLRIDSDRPVRLLTLTTGDDSLITIDLNDGAPLTAVRDGVLPARLEMKAASGIADGEWHHLLLQCGPGSMQVVFDGGQSAVSSDAWKTAGVRSVKFGGDSRSLAAGSLDDIRLHDRTFTLGEVETMVYQWQQLKPTNSDHGLIGVYHLDGNGINTMGLGWNGVSVGSLTTTLDRYGHAGAASLFDGRTYIELDGDATFAGSNFSMGLWFRTARRSAMTVLGIADPGGNSLRVVVNDDSAIGLRVDDHLALAYGQAGLFADDRWHHLLVQRTTAGFELHVDAVLLGEKSVTARLDGPGSRVRIGRGGGAAACWIGALDELVVYARSMNQPEIAGLRGFQFHPKDGAGALAFDDRLWLIGGWNPYATPTTDNEVWSTADGESWTLAPESPWEGRHTAGYLVHDGKMWLLGGDRSRGHYQNEIWCSADGGRWQQVTAHLPWADRVLFMSASFRGRMWVLGGTRIGAGLAFNDVYSSADGVDWRLDVAAAPWSPRGMVHGTLVFRDRLWIVGGGRYDGRIAYNDVWSSPDGVHWERVLAAAPWEPRQYHAVTVFQGKLWVVGGVSTSEPAGLDDIWCSADGVHWQRLQHTAWPGRHAASVATHRDSLWIAGGTGTRSYNDVWRMNLAD